MPSKIMCYEGFLALLISIQILRGLSQNLIETQDGKILGVSDQWVTSFLGIRYAQSPVRARRLAPPVAVTPWNGTLRAEEYGPACLQAPDSSVHKYLNNVRTGEDCLNLNIFIPRDSLGKNIPVLIFIHPGQFQCGAAAMVNGSFLAMETQAIVVTINYRLGVFGFAYSKSLLSGNYGIQDQILAIKWIRKNIASFGGDEDNIAILADSGNARILRYIPKINKTFSKIVSLPLDIPYSFPTNPQSDTAESVLESVCNGTISRECFHRIHPEQLLNLTLNQSPWSLPIFGPINDGEIWDKRSYIHSNAEQVHLNVVAPSYIYRKTSVVIQGKHYQCTPNILKNVIHMISTMTSSNVSALLETFYFPDDVTANSICNEVLRLLYDYASISSISDLDRASRSSLVFLAVLEPYYVLQGGSSDPMCLFRGGGEGCDSDATSAFVLTAVKSFLKDSYPSSDDELRWRPYTVHSKSHVIYNGYKTSAGDRRRWPLVQQERLWHDLAPAFKGGGLEEKLHEIICPAARTEWGMTETQLEILLYSLVFCCLFLVFVSMTLVRILCTVNKPAKKETRTSVAHRTAASSEGGHYNGACNGEMEDSKF